MPAEWKKSFEQTKFSNQWEHIYAAGWRAAKTASAGVTCSHRDTWAVYNFEGKRMYTIPVCLHKSTPTERAEVKVSRADLQKFCTMAAEHIPVYRDWDPKCTKPWGCILSESNPGYCDQCPAVDICPHDHKEFSK